MMARIPVDTTRLTGLVAVTDPEPKINLETGEVRTDRDGRTVYLVSVALRVADGGRKAVVIEVATTEEPKGVEVGTPVRLVGLDAVPWEMNNRHGLSYKAAAVLPVTATSAAAAATANTPRSNKGADA